jgi:hypothetical protein
MSDVIATSMPYMAIIFWTPVRNLLTVFQEIVFCYPIIFAELCKWMIKISIIMMVMIGPAFIRMSASGVAK